MNREILEQIGLSKNEIKVYFALLELDQSSATPIIKKADIPYSKVYPTLDKLIGKGLVSFVIKNNVKYFQANNPENLIEFIDNKEKQLIEQKKEIQTLIPDLERKRKSAKEKQEALVFESLEGIKAAFNRILDTLEEGEEYQVLTLGKELEESKLITFFNNYHKKRIERKIKARLIANTSIKKIFLKYHKYKDMKLRYSNAQIPLGIFIYGENVMTFVWGDNPAAFVITSKANAKAYKDFFEQLWKAAKP
jgi:sugar-specific transcriptional regulator TrmB